MQSPGFASHVRCSAITRRQPISTDCRGTGKVPVKTVAQDSEIAKWSEFYLRSNPPWGPWVFKIKVR